MANQYQDLTNNRVDSLYTKVVDLHGRQIKNAADSTDPGDYVTKRELLVQIASLQDIIANSTKSSPIYNYPLHYRGAISFVSDALVRDFIASNSKILALRADLKVAPSSAAVTFKLYQVSVDLSVVAALYFFAFTSGVKTMIVPDSVISTLPPLIKNYFFYLDIITVSGTSFGSDLSITVRAQ